MAGCCCGGGVHGCGAGLCYSTLALPDSLVPGAWSVSCAYWRPFVFIVGVP